jgi:hypothetical protein
MTSIRDIPLEDIKTFLSENKIGVPKNIDNAYKTAFDLIQSGKAKFYPDNVVTWIMAYNLIKSKKNIPMYNKSIVISLSKQDVEKLAKSLGMKSDNMDAILSILTYLHKLNDDTINRGLLPTLEIKMLEVMDLETLLKTFKTNKQAFRPLLYQALPEIIDNYYYQENLPKNVNRKLDYYDLYQFTDDLFDLKEYTLVKRILQLTYPKDDIYGGLVYGALYDQEELEAYFKMAPENYDWNMHGFDEAFEHNMEGIASDGADFNEYFSVAFNAAINTKNQYVLKYLIETWNLMRDDWVSILEDISSKNPLGAYSMEFINISSMIKNLDNLSEKAKEIV